MSSYFGQFKRFDPLKGKLPDFPFSLLPMIAFRARALLKSRTIDQIESVAKAIDFAIYCHFDEIKENEITRLRQILTQSRGANYSDGDLEYQHALQFFDWDGGSLANGRWLFKDSMEDSLGIPTLSNTGEVYALKELAEWWNDMLQDFPDGKGYELFAVLSLWQLADSIHWLKDKDINGLNNLLKDAFTKLEAELKMSGLSENFHSGKEQNLSFSGESALQAMDAVCYAEHLFFLEKEIDNLHEARKLEHQIEEKNRRLDISRKLNIARHQNRNEALALATTEWGKDPNKFSSAEKAGLHFADWLDQHGFSYEPRTVTGWIRAYARKIGVKFR
jgi:hypothetical protein